MSVARGQQRTVLSLLAGLRPHWRQDRALPARIQSLLRADRRFGSRDRRLYRELIYTALRYLPWIEPWLDRDPDQAVQRIAWLAADSPATARFRAEIIAHWPPCPRTMAEKAAILTERLPQPVTSPETPEVCCDGSALLPAWFREHCPDAFEPAQLDALLARAPLWLRLQTSDAAVVAREFDQLGWRWQHSSVLPAALQVFDDVDVTKTAAFRDGLVEIQDLGSQLILTSTRIAPGGRWLDACAGAGGKTLQLAALLGPGGQIDAFDIRQAALAELAARATRAGVPVEGGPNAPASGRSAMVPRSDRFAAIRILGQAPIENYDGVLVDAPCSGSGTWRRAPHLKWTTRPEDIAEASAQQRRLLHRFSERVRPGGRLIYATCSLSRQENEAVVTAFLQEHQDFSAELPAETFGVIPRDGGLTLLPALHNTDGFFVAGLRRAAR